jgi:hypothetical protein
MKFGRIFRSLDEIWNDFEDLEGFGDGKWRNLTIFGFGKSF